MAVTESGYDFDFVDDVSDELICVVCHLVLKEPVQLVQSVIDYVNLVSTK